MKTYEITIKIMVEKTVDALTIEEEVLDLISRGDKIIVVEDIKTELKTK